MTRYPYLVTFRDAAAEGGPAGILVESPHDVTSLDAEGVATACFMGYRTKSEKSAAKMCRRDVARRDVANSVGYTLLTTEEAWLIL